MLARQRGRDPGEECSNPDLFIRKGYTLCPLSLDKNHENIFMADNYKGLEW